MGKRELRFVAHIEMKLSVPTTKLHYKIIGIVKLYLWFCLKLTPYPAWHVPHQKNLTKPQVDVYHRNGACSPASIVPQPCISSCRFFFAKSYWINSFSKCHCYSRFIHPISIIISKVHGRSKRKLNTESHSTGQKKTHQVMQQHTSVIQLCAVEVQKHKSNFTSPVAYICSVGVPKQRRMSTIWL